ncbi:MAG: metallopeptidase family protein [Candidatus Eisenbacteria bacterium]|uniref:Metallopeptidase family protein n=1 Tax=Eiseniibacteriota bacterium TaxID=2212470 RepID=A0A948W421_UNCEI|nr:metallopeptidase family protein [Candidatus Eisenbacteria bacterium]MBU1947511.1 metallopeptidase family protein [Candidatus Eisenbacteria bacterium]MBU2691732.1 metallopeptidase family protein [Candidatus Eisenbacteria bacterium]
MDQQKRSPLAQKEKGRLDGAWRALETGDFESAAETAEVLVDETGRHPDALQLLGAALVELGFIRAGLGLLREAGDNVEDLPLSQCYEGIAYFERAQFIRARRCFQAAVEKETDFGYAYYGLGRCADFAKRYDLADRYYTHAYHLDPFSCPLPVRMQRSFFEAIVKEAIDLVPKELRDALVQIPVIVEELPDSKLLRVERPPLRPDILGIFVGRDMRERSSFSPPSPQEALLIYQRNLELFCPTKEDLICEISVTLTHEMGHALGIEEEDFREQGLE